MLGTIVKRAFWIAYDRLGRLVLLNMIWFLLAFGPAIPILHGVQRWPPVFSFLAVFALILYVGLLSGGVYYSLMFMEEETDSNFLKLFCRGLWRGLRTVLPLLALDVIVLLLLVYGVVFYLERMPGVFGKLLAGVSLWMTVFWLLSQQYFLPLASMAGCSSVTALKRSFSLALDNFFFSFGLFLLGVVFVALCVLPFGVGLMLFAIAGLGALYRAAGEFLFQKYDLSFHPDYSVEDMRRWQKEGRGLREFFRPWE